MKEALSLSLSLLSPRYCSMKDFTIRRLDFRLTIRDYSDILFRPRGFQGILSGEDQQLIIANDRVLT